jgi:hypothetical protein
VSQSEVTKMAEKPVKKEKVKKQKKGNALRRFNRWLTFLILLGLAGFVFYTGWVQEKIPEGYGALIFTKVTYKEGKLSGGYDETLTANDGFHWRWERLFPTNMTIHLYPLSLRNITISSQGTLPSGDIYMNFMEESQKERFDWDISFDLTYRLKEENIPRLAMEQGIMPENLEAFFAQEENRIEGELYQILKDITPSLTGTKEIDAMRTKLDQSHPFIEITSLSPRILIMPDLTLYNKSRDLYFSYLDTRNASLENMITREAPKMAVNEEKMKILVEYGKILTEYPVLIDFFALDENNDFDRFTPSSLMPESLKGTE